MAKSTGRKTRKAKQPAPGRQRVLAYEGIFLCLASPPNQVQARKAHTERADNLLDSTTISQTTPWQLKISCQVEHIHKSLKTSRLRRTYQKSGETSNYQIQQHFTLQGLCCERGIPFLFFGFFFGIEGRASGLFALPTRASWTGVVLRAKNGWRTAFWVNGFV